MSNNYGHRSVWCLKFMGSPQEIHKKMMEDDTTRIGIMEFPPVDKKSTRHHWTYVTNGMAERRMPFEVEPHGDPKIRIELMAYSSVQSTWIIDLLHAMAKYPFLNRSGFAYYHTIPVSAPPPRLWDGYILIEPFAEDEEFNPLRLYPEENSDITFFLQIFGLKQKELDYAITHGGKEFVDLTLENVKHQKEIWSLLALDIERESMI